MRFFGVLTVLVALLGQACATERFLEQGNDDASVDYTSYNMKFARCLRTKIIEDNDDEGNSYFYNGSYRSQSISYASFHLCASGSKCGTCDKTTEYVTDLENFLESNVDYVQEYCGKCTNQCRRRLEDAAEEEEEEEEEENDQSYSVDCDACSNRCALLTNGNEGTDESQYLACQASFVDDSGNQIYSAPTCGSNQGLTMGLFYDDECTIKKSDQIGFSEGFGYNTFSTIETMCTDCANDDVCKDLVGESVQCAEGYSVDYDGGDDDGIDDNRLCKLFKQASKERQYAKRKREFTLMPVVFLLLLLGGFFASSTYTYFVRHKKAAEAALLEGNDDLNDSSKGNFAQMT